MLTAERRARIQRELARRNRIEVTTFAATWGFSEMTIRRDLNAMAAEGLVRRVRGGAVPMTPMPGDDVTPSTRGSIGIIVADSRPHTLGIVRGASETAKAAGYRVLLGSSRGSRVDEELQISRMMDHGVDGLLLAPTRAERGAIPDWDVLRTLPVPVVVVEPAPSPLPPSLRADLVLTDHQYGAYVAVDHLRANGHDRIGLLTTDTGTARALRAGLHDALPPDQHDAAAHMRVITGEQTLHTLEQHVSAFIDDCLTAGVTAALINGDDTVSVFMAELQRRGLRIPEDFAFVAYGDESAAVSSIPLSAVALPSVAIGSRAVEICVSRLRQQRPSPPARLTLLPRLAARESSLSPLSEATAMLAAS